MKKFFVFTLVLAAIVVVVPWVSAQAGVTSDTISIKFGANEPSPDGSALPADAVAGVPGVESANWNNARDAGGSLDNLVRDNFGVMSTTTAGAGWSTTNTWSSGTNDNFDGANRTLMMGYLDQDQVPRTITIVINNVPDDFATYDVYVYFLGDTAHRGGVYTVAGVSKFGFVTSADTGPDFNDAARMVPPASGNYLVFSGVTTRNVRIEADNDIGFRAPINAIQLVNRTAP